MVGDDEVIPTESRIATTSTFPETEVGDSSFSWYCRRPTAETAGACVRMGETMLGLAADARTRPAWAGTAAATLLNMAKMCLCVVG